MSPGTDLGHSLLSCNYYLEEKANLHLAITSFQKVVESGKIYLDDKLGRCNLQVFSSQIRTSDLLDLPL